MNNNLKCNNNNCSHIHTSVHTQEETQEALRGISWRLIMRSYVMDPSIMSLKCSFITVVETVAIRSRTLKSENRATSPS